MNDNLSWPEKIGFYLEDIETPIGITINLIVFALTVVSLSIFIVETYPISQQTRTLLEDLDFTILILFTLEYITRFCCAQNKVKFLINIFSILDLLAITPLFIGFVDIRFLRIFRWFRLLRAIRLIQLETSLFKLQTTNVINLNRGVLILFSTIFVYAGLIYQIEDSINPSVFNNFFDALYFCIVTMTTVGFGDVIPLSGLGRMVTVVMIFTGIILIPWQITELTRQLSGNTKQIKNECLNCGLIFHDFDAFYCKKCGDKLKENKDRVIPERLSWREK